MLDKAGKREESARSYRSLTLTSCLGKPLEKAIADNLGNWAEAAKSLINNKMVSEKIGAQMIIYLNFLKLLNLVSVRVIQLQEYFLMSRKPSTKYGMMNFSFS